jgi:nuclear pore complex protein Nup155
MASYASPGPASSLAPFGTPARPVPGIYPQTPAPKTPAPPPSFQMSTYGRSPSYSQANPSTSLTTSRPSDPTSTLQRPAETLTPAERAARTLNQKYAEEGRFPELDSYLTQGQSSEYEIQTSSTWAPFQKVRMYNIPDQIFEQYNKAQVSTLMGLFASLRHAWVTIDNAIYLWDYTATNPELLGFEGQSQTITAVELAKPKAGVFLDSIKHMIILATTSELVILGLGTDSAPGGAQTLSLFRTGMSTAIRGLEVTVIAHSAKQGRVFFGGRSDNDIYELTYQQQDGWFSSKCARKNHTRSTGHSLTLSLTLASAKSEFVEQIVIDDTRNLLYTLSSRSTIRVFHMTTDGGLNLLITRSARDTYSNISHIVTPNESLNANIKIVSISPISQQEASRYSLVATTATGYRIYLSTAASSYWGSSQNSPPVSMQALYVRLPPSMTNGSSAATGVSQPPNPNMPIKTLTTTRLARRYAPGFFFCLTAQDANSPVDNLFVSAPDAARIFRQPEAGQPPKSTESATWLSLGSRAEDIGVSVPYNAPTSTPAGFGNDLAVQFDTQIPEISILTNTGIHVIKRRRLVDIFAGIIRQGGVGEGLYNEVNAMVRAYGRTETLATALAVACGQGVEVAQDARSIRIQDPEVLEFARKFFVEQGGKPSINQNLITDKNMPLIDAVRPSPRHEAMALYLSRLLRSTWRSKIAIEVKKPNEYLINPAVALDKIRTIQEDLASLQRFFVANKTFIKGLSGPDDLPPAGSRDEEIALQGEHRALHALVKFVANTIEGLSFVLVLFEEKVAEIVPLLPETSRPAFLQLTFEDLFSSKRGHELAKELVKAIVNRNIAKGSNVETVADALRRRCGNFCSADDVVIFKAQEQLKRAAEAGANSDVARNLLNESLRLFEEVAHSLPNDYLRSAVKQYTDLKFFAGALQLTLKVAHEQDKANEALSWLTDGRPKPDPREAKFDKRTQCYDLIHDVIVAVDQSTANEPNFIDGRPTLVAIRRNEAYDVIARSNDETFLTNLYDWYISQGWQDRVLTTESPFTVKYLQRKAADDITYGDLMWKYYGQTHQYQDAAQVQLGLAQSGFNLSLDRRIEYLSRARANASTYTQGGNRKTKQKLLQDISELLDIASIQEEILSRLRDDPRLPAERKVEVIDQIDGNILDISTLYNKYANAAAYYDICLLIFQAADHRDLASIKQTWQQLLQQEHDLAADNEQGPQPFEQIAEVVRALGAKLRLSETIFRLDMLLPMLLTYSYEHQRNIAPDHWVVDIFIDLSMTYEQIFDVLEAMFYQGDGSFVGSNRRILAHELLYIVARWAHDSTKAGGLLFGSNEGAQRVDDMMALMVQASQKAGLDARTVQECRSIQERIAMTLV